MEPSALQDLADRVVAQVEKRAAPLAAEVEANVRVSRTRHGLTRFANSFIHQHVGEDTVSVSMTLAVDGRTTSVSTTKLDEQAVDELIAAGLTSARLQPPDPYWPGATPPTAVPGEDRIDPATAGATPDQRALLVRDFIDAGEGLLAAGFVDTELDQLAFASTAGHRTVGATTRATLDAIQQTERSAGAAHATSRALVDLDAAALGAQAAQRARRSADIRELDPGTYEVVLAPEAVATTLVFLSVYGFNARAHLEGSSFVELGRQQFDPAITLLEDPTDPRAIGVPFDAEGTPRQRFALVETGTSQALAHDRRTALRAGTASTGNAVPGGEGFGAIPMNLVLTAGVSTPDELVAGVERGLLVSQFHYVRILDPKSQVATGLTRNGTFLIEDGEVTGAVGNLRFTQSLIAALSDGQVLGVGDDARYADAEFGPGMVICPSLRLAGWSFTGGSRG